MHEGVIGHRREKFFRTIERQRLNENLAGAPAEQRRFVAEDLSFHHSDAGTEQDKKNAGLAQIFIPALLKQGRDGRIAFDQIGEFIELHASNLLVSNHFVKKNQLGTDVSQSPPTICK